MTTRRIACLAACVAVISALASVGTYGSAEASSTPTGPTIGIIPPTDPTAYCQPNLPALIDVIDYCRAMEGVGPLTLPNNFSSLTPQEQLLVLFSLERVNRGETAVAALAASLDGDAQQGAKVNDDPPLKVGGASGGVWEATSSTLWADQAFLYTDDCTPTNVKNCWGHRDIILDNSDTTDVLVGGAGYAPKNLDNTWNSYTFEFAYGYATQDYVFTWSDELAHFARPPAVEPLQPPTITGISPTVVSVGGQYVTISGSDLVSTTHIAVGDASATHVSCVSETRCTAFVPAHSPGAASVHVTAAGGTSQSSPASTISYDRPRLIRESSAATSASAGGVFAHPLAVAVTLAGERARGVPVTFTVTSGGARFSGGHTKATVATASNGVATSPLIVAGRRPGNSKVIAAAAGGTDSVSWQLRVNS